MLALALHFFSATAVVSAAPIVVPAGLQPGDQYRVVFVTSAMRDGLSQDINVYNSFVAGIANSSPELAALGTTWRVIASTPTVDAIDNTSTDPSLSVGVPIYNLAGQLVAATYFDLWGGPGSVIHLGAPVRYTENGNLFDSPVWTGTLDHGTQPLPGVALGSTFGTITGWSNLTSKLWINTTASLPDYPLPFYGMSGVLTVVPEPSSLAIATVGLLGTIAWHYRRRPVTFAQPRQCIVQHRQQVL